MNKPVAPPPRRALGRGIEALLPASRPAVAPAPAASDSVLILPLDQIRPNPNQPRRHFDEHALTELADSIRVQGVLQPVLVRRHPDMGGYELVAGERRLRAAERAGLQHIPALVRTWNDERSLEIALIENLQRQDLNPVEQARGLEELSNRFALTQEQVAQRTGMERSTVANLLRLLRLDPEVLELLTQGRLSPGQARPLLACDAALQRSLGRQIAEQAWPARRVEQHVAQLIRPAPPPTPEPARDPNERAAEEELARALGAKVAIQAGRNHRGTIVIAFNDLDEFQRLYDRMINGVS